MRLTPVEQEKPAISAGHLFERRDHYLHVWLEGIP
jgi:hypothetical protein